MARRSPRIANYPPLGIVLFWLQGKLLDLPDQSARVGLACPDPNCGWQGSIAVQDTPMTRQEDLRKFVCPKCRRTLAQLHPDPWMLINTFQSRLVMSLASVLAELILAVGIFLLARHLLSAKAGLLAAGVCWLFPPLAMDSSFWGQTDSWMLAPTVLFLYLMLRRRWMLAGLCLAITGLLKPQGIFLGPIALLGAALVAFDPGEARMPARMPSPLRGMVGTFLVLSQRSRFWLYIVRLKKMIGTAIVAVLILTLPWMISDGAAWVQESYVANLKMYGQTTLKAFNFWYIDALSSDPPVTLETAPRGDPLSSEVEVLGVTKDGWGRMLALAAMITLGALSWLKYRARPELAMVIFSGLWLWSTFIWPTRVHERYIVYGMPLVILAAVMMKRLWPAVVGLAIVGAVEMCHNVWLKMPAGGFAQGALFRQANGLFGQIRQQFPNLPQDPSRWPPNLRSAFENRVAQEQTEIASLRAESKSREQLATFGSLASYAWAVIAAFWVRSAPNKAPPAPPPQHPHRKKRR
jgi:hypothetical protein